MSGVKGATALQRGADQPGVEGREGCGGMLWRGEGAAAWGGVQVGRRGTQWDAGWAAGLPVQEVPAQSGARAGTGGGG